MRLSLIFMIYLFSLSAFAGSECALYELSGNVVTGKSDMMFIVGQKTLSEKKLPIYFKLSNDFAPFVNRYAKGTFILKAQSIIGIKSIDYAVPDPLNQNQSSTSNKLKDVSCPKL